MKKPSSFRYWAPAILLGAAAISPLACTSANGQAPQSQVQALLDSAHQLEVRGKVDLAAQRWQQVLLADPNNTEALGGLARAAKAMGNTALAGTYIDRLRAINPNDPGIERAEETQTQKDQSSELQQAGKLAQQGQYGQAMNVYRQLYGNEPPPGDTALAYYETESATEEGRPHAIAGLRSLSAKFPNDSRYQVALGRILTYNPKTRPEGRRLLEQHPNDPQAVEALRQSLLWDSQNPATAGDIRAYLVRHPDETLSTVLRNEPRVTRAAPMTAQQRAAAAVNASRSAEDRDAYRTLNEKHLPEAEAKFKAILAKTPDDANALAGMGYIRMQQANFGGAISFLVQAKSDGSKDPGLDAALATSRFWYTMGEGAIALNEGDLPTAEKEYRAALQMRPQSTEALEGLGGTLLKAQQPDAAVPVFMLYVKVKPSAAHAWRGLFLAQYGMGNATLALNTERQIPNAVKGELARDPLYLRSLASALSSVGRDADAARVLKSALDLPFSPNSPQVETDTKLQYAGLLLQAKHYDQAAGLYRQVLSKEPNNVAAYQGLVRVQHAAGQDDQALQTIEAMPSDVYSKAMGDGGFDVSVASIYQTARRLDVAQDILEKTLQQEAAQNEKPAVNVQIQLAGIYLQRGNATQAYPLYQKVLTQHPDRLDAWKGLIDALHSTGRDQEALTQIQQMPPAIRQQLEGDVDYLQTVGAIYNALGQPQEAAIFLRRVEAHYAAQKVAPPADVEVQNAWLLYNGHNDTALYQQLMMLGGRTDLTDLQRRTVQTIWTNYAVRRANQAAAAGHDKLALDILNATAQAFPGNPEVIKALAGGYARAGMPKQAVAIWKSMDLTTADPDDYRSAVGAALAANDQADAEKWLRFALNQYPNNAELLVLAAKFEQQRGDVNRAADYYKAAFKNMPADDPGAALATELSHPPTAAELPGSARGAQDLSHLLAPGTEPANPQSMQPMAPSQPYLPGGAGANMAPVPLGGTYRSPSYAAPMYGTPTLPSQSPTGTPRLKDYVPQSSVIEPGIRAGEDESPHVATLDLQEELPVLSPASFHHQQIVRLTEQAAYTRVMQSPEVVDQPHALLASLAPPALGEDLFSPVSDAPAGFELPQQQQQPQVAQPQAAQQTGQKAPAAPAPTTTNVVYGPYVPYVPPAKRTPAQQTSIQQAGAQAAAAQPSSQVQVPQPTRPLTVKPTGQAAQATRNAAIPATATKTNDVVYGPYVPYTPPPATSVQLGATPPTRQIKQPEVTDILPTAKYAPNANAKVPAASRAELSAEAAERRRASARAAKVTGQSKPPDEVYATPATEPAQYTTPLTKTPSQPAVFTQPALQPAQTVVPGESTSAVPQQNGDSYGQQYPQPRTASEPVTHVRVRRARPAVVRAPAPVQVETRGPALSYPGVGSALGYQPYPVIGPAYPLPSAPTDQDLMQKQLPPLRGAYYTGEMPGPQVPLTERQQAERDLAELEASYSGWIGGTGSARYRSGTVGYDRLTDVETTFEASSVAGNSVRFSVVPKAVFLNSGQFDVGNYTGVTGSPVIGTFNSGVAVNNPSEQFANGVGGELQATGKNFALALGYTPYEFLVENVTGRALFRPNNHFTLYASRDSVNETQLSYAGLRDPGSATNVYAGNIWGGVVSTGGGVRFDMGDEKAGFYITTDGADLTGYHVLQNSKFEGSMGAYFLAHTFPGYGRLNVGLSLFGMHYAQEERQLSYGLGGYFSPDAYFLASVPVTFTGRYHSNFHYTIAGAVGVQTFQEDSQVYFPLDRGIQTGFATSQNCTTATIANHTCGQYPNNSNTGGNYSINTEGAYRIADHWYAGGFLSANNTNNYNTVSAGFFVRYLFRPQVGSDDYPTGIFPVEGFRPLRVP
jgi:tetratricopeptide (TPR) repeat protein